MQNFRLALFATAIGLFSSACARPQASVVVPEAPLGRVIIYRNGVAYFERNAVVEGELVLKVPRDRIDDFLKSLTVVDVETGKPLPISYPTTRETVDRFVDMTIELPPERREIRITYVTESPAWKPSYRVVLEEGGRARLLSWAVVDNVSGEAWDHVQVGVGSTSALSFRYDLHSVRVVERETIDQGTKIAQAPPMGGSPYAVEGDKRRLLANLSDEDLVNGAAISLQGTTGGVNLGGAEGAGNEEFRNIPVGSQTQRALMKVETTSRRRGRKRKPGKGKRETDLPASSTSSLGQPAPISALDRLVVELQGNQTRVRLEGNAVRGEIEAEQQGLRRANTLRDQLIQRGISSDRIEVVAGSLPVADKNNALKVVAIEEKVAPTLSVSDQDGSPRGTAHFVSDRPIDLDSGHSAMITLLDEPTDAQRVYLYDPISERGSKRFAFNAVRLDNPSDHTLDTGPVTVYADQQFLGEGLADPIPPRATAVVPYAMDRTLRVRPRMETTETIERLVKVERGIATTQTKRTRTTILEIANRGTKAARVYVRHRVASGWALANIPPDIERLGDDYLIPITIDAGGSATLTLDETMPITTAIDLRSQPGFRSIEVYLDTHEVAPELTKKLGELLDAHRRLHDLDAKLATRGEQMDVLRQRVVELNVQLVTLRKVGKAQSLSSHLAKRMRQLGDKLDDATIAVTELQTDRLTARIELADMVAELSLDAPDAGSGARSVAASPAP